MFAIFQEEFKQSMIYQCVETQCEGVTTIYKVTNGTYNGQDRIVAFEDGPEASLSCMCKKFEEGILCRHILRL